MIKSFLDNRSQYFWWSVGFLLIPIFGAIDHWSGYEHNVVFLYFVPIILVSWYSGWMIGAIAAGTSALMWLAADISSGHPYTSGLIYLWNAGVYLGLFLLVAYLVSRLAKSINQRTQLAKLDQLTGSVANSTFSKLVNAELYRMQRYEHPFTLAYIDLDELNKVNQEYGYDTGDKVLIAIVDGIKSQIRQSDVIGRIGGDEFAVLLPETGVMEAQVVFSRIQRKLKEIMSQYYWGVTFSLGVVTCTDASCEPNMLIKMANSLMEDVKRESKNGINYGVYSKATSSIMGSG